MVRCNAGQLGEQHGWDLVPVGLDEGPHVAEVFTSISPSSQRAFSGRKALLSKALVSRRSWGPGCAPFCWGLLFAARPAPQLSLPGREGGEEGRADKIPEQEERDPVPGLPNSATIAQQHSLVMSTGTGSRFDGTCLPPAPMPQSSAGTSCRPGLASDAMAAHCSGCLEKGIVLGDVVGLKNHAALGELLAARICKKRPTISSRDMVRM